MARFSGQIKGVMRMTDKTWMLIWSIGFAILFILSYFIISNLLTKILLMALDLIVIIYCGIKYVQIK